ncbi:beta-mannosidase [Tabrizicola sp.]|uniref:beta-mannosidase n=1 Tax=Tabrizicola sp. TaxID=2005166 RepID=UPI003F396226
MLDLAGVWTLSDESGAHVVPFDLPGDGITALVKAGVIPDPYWGRNEYDCRWVCERDWVATRTFTVDRTDLTLVIDMLDTVAEVFVNGVSVLQADSMFHEHRVYLSPMKTLRVGENEISIRFASPVRVAAERQAGMPFYIPYAAQNCPIPNGNMLRKPACDFGWDWNIALAPFGVYGSIRLEPDGGLHFRSPVIQQVHAPGQVDVHVTVWLFGGGDFNGDVTLTCAGVSETKKARHGKVSLSVTIEDPELWWPVGLGDQKFHDLTLTSGEASLSRRIGLRELELITEKDSVGTGFKFRVNGRDVFAKGANWIPADALASNITPEATRDLLKSAVDANMNMIRVWGGGRYEPDWFYDLCDELGLMVWQDFMFACNLYPSTVDFISSVRIEVLEQVRRLHHHPCIALWCGDNELIGALTWFPESRKDRDRYLVNYDRLNRAIEMQAKQGDPSANWWPSSPSPGPMSFGDAWHDDSSGDMHFWSVWHEGRDFDHYRDVSPRFCSEFGFQSYPSMSVIRRFADPKDWNIASPVMESHQKNAGGNARIAETMFRYFRFPVDFESFVYLSQVQQGLAIKTAVTHWRSLKPHCMGTLYWQLNDTWPVCSWSSLDHGGNWKLLHHMAKEFYAPVTVVAIPKDGTITLKALNDSPQAARISVTVRAAAMDGSTRELGQAEVAVPTDAAVPVLTLAPDALGPGEVLVFTWTGDAEGGDVHAPKPWKAYDLQHAGLSHEVAKDGAIWKLTLKVKALAPFVAIESEVPGRFSANAVTLFPGHPATITFTPNDPSSVPQFTFRDLHSATYGA